MVNSLIPAAVRNKATGEPKPPAPICSTFVLEIFSCPFSPILGDIICLEYLSFCLSVNIFTHLISIFLIFLIISSISMKNSPKLIFVFSNETKIICSST
ncbi:MAG: hypothetical protein ACXAAH_06420, partial [Promethearchaeota archaeon]